MDATMRERARGCAVGAAVGDALANARRTGEDKMARVTSGLRIPGL